VVPAFDEEDGIEGVVSRLSGLALSVPVEILVVDDGSTDGTVATLERIAPRYPKLRVIRHDRNRGYGAALKTGFASARHEVVVITDADGTYPENQIAELLARIDAGAEMAVGARTGPEVEVPLLRRPAKAILRLLASYLAGVRIPDLNSGLRAIRRELVKTYRPILSDGFSFTTTITLSALTNGHRVDWVSIDYKKRQGTSKIRPIRDRTAKILGGIVEAEEWEVAVMHRQHGSATAACTRVTWLRVDSGAADEMINDFVSLTLPALNGIRGFCSASLLVNREWGRAAVSVAYDSPDAMERGPARSDGKRQLGDDIIDVREFDLVMPHLRVPDLASY